MLLEIIFFTFMSLIFLILLALSFPCSYNLEFMCSDKINYQFKIGTFFLYFKSYKLNGENKTHIQILNFTKEIGKSKKEIKKKDEKKELNKRKIIAMISKENVKHFFRLGKDIWQQIKPENIEMDLKLSLSDPCYNGLILAGYYSCKEIYPDCPLSLSINWEREVIKGKGQVTGSFVPLLLLGKIITFVLSPRSVKMIWKIIRKRKV